jgi:hypothetical protein
MLNESKKEVVLNSLVQLVLVSHMTSIHIVIFCEWVTFTHPHSHPYELQMEGWMV